MGKRPSWPLGATTQQSQHSIAYTATLTRVYTDGSSNFKRVVLWIHIQVIELQYTDQLTCKEIKYEDHFCTLNNAALDTTLTTLCYLALKPLF